MIPSEEALIAELSQPTNKQAINRLAKLCVYDVSFLNRLFALSFHSNASISFRATWVLETTALSKLISLEPILNKFLERFPEYKGTSCQRHVSRIIILLNKEKVESILKDTYLKADLQVIVDTLFSWLLEPKGPVAVKANCMEALAGMVPIFPWIKEELLDTIDYLRDRESVAFFGRAKRVLPKLKKLGSLQN